MFRFSKIIFVEAARLYYFLVYYSSHVSLYFLWVVLSVLCVCSVLRYDHSFVRNYISQRSQLLMDGTFDLSPISFKQAYAIHSCFGMRVLLFVCAFQTHVTRRIYTAMVSCIEDSVEFDIQPYCAC
jgi:hypothetical protein